MNIPFLILAQVITAYTYPPDEQGGRITDIRIESMADPILDYMSRMDESQKIGQAARTGQVYDPFSGQTMIKTQAPPNPYYNMSYEEAAKRRQIESENLQREVRTKSELLNQKIEDFEYNYKRNMTDQSDRFLDDMKGLDPRSPDYITRRHELSSTYPLAAQNPLILRNLDLLDKTYNGIEQDKQVMNRQQVIAEEAARERDVTQGRTMAAKYGARGLAMYEELLKKDPRNPIGAIAAMEDAQQQESRISQLNELQIPRSEQEKFYTPEIDVGGRPTGRRVLDTRRVDAFIRSYPTASNAAQAAAGKQKVRENTDAIGKTYDEWPEHLKADYDFYDQQIQRYRSLTGQPKEEKVAPAIKSVDDFF